MSAPDPILSLKSELARAVVAALDGWSQSQAAALLDTDQPRVSDLRRDRLARFSLEQLIRFAARMGADVNLGITWTERRRLLSTTSPIHREVVTSAVRSSRAPR